MASVLLVSGLCFICQWPLFHLSVASVLFVGGLCSICQWPLFHLSVASVPFDSGLCSHLSVASIPFLVTSVPFVSGFCSHLSVVFLRKDITYYFWSFLSLTNVVRHYQFELEPVFVKHYVPTICLPLNMAKFCQNFIKS